MSDHKEAIREKLARLKSAFVERALDDAGTLESLAQSIARPDAGAQGDDREEIRHIAHRLAGAAGIFGFASLTGAAVGVEDVARSDADAMTLGGHALGLAGEIRRVVGPEGERSGGDPDTQGEPLPRPRAASAS